MKKKPGCGWGVVSRMQSSGSRGSSVGMRAQGFGFRIQVVKTNVYNQRNGRSYPGQSNFEIAPMNLKPITIF